jgi:ferredoxin
MDKETGLPVVDKAKCTGCRMCITECPQGLFTGIARNQKGAMTLCGNRNPIKQGLIKTCKAACLKCGVCVKNCPKSCIKLDGNISVVDRTICDSCGTCVEKCPTKALRIIEKDVLSA